MKLKGINQYPETIQEVHEITKKRSNFMKSLVQKFPCNTYTFCCASNEPLYYHQRGGGIGRLSVPRILYLSGIEDVVIIITKI